MPAQARARRPAPAKTAEAETSTATKPQSQTEDTSAETAELLVAIDELLAGQEFNAADYLQQGGQ